MVKTSCNRSHHLAATLLLQGALTIAIGLVGTPANGGDYVAIMQDPTSATEKGLIEGTWKPLEVELDPYVEHAVYVVVWSTKWPLCVAAWEGSLCGWAANDPSFHVTSVTLLPQGTAFNLASPPEYVVGRGSELHLEVGQVGVLAEVKFMFTPDFEAGRIVLTGTPCGANPFVDGCGLRREVLGDRGMLIKNAQKYDSTPYATEREIFGPPPELNPLELPYPRYDVVAGVGSVLDLVPYVENAIGDLPRARVTVSVSEYWEGSGNQTLVLYSDGIINHEWGPNAYWSGKGSTPYLTPGDNIIFVGMRMAERSRRAYSEQDLPYHLSFARYLLGALDDDLQEAFEQSQVEYDFPVDPVLLRGPVDLQRLQRVLVPSGQSVQDIREEITRYYLPSKR